MCSLGCLTFGCLLRDLTTPPSLPQTFVDAEGLKAADLRHPNDPSLTCESLLPITPDFECWSNTYVQMQVLIGGVDREVCMGCGDRKVCQLLLLGAEVVDWLVRACWRRQR